MENTDAKVMLNSNNYKALGAYHSKLAKELVAKNDFMAALDHAEIALKYNYSMETIRNKAKILYLKKDFIESIKQYQSALSYGRVKRVSDDEIASIELELSLAYVGNGDIQEARNHYRTYLQLIGFFQHINENDDMNTTREVGQTSLKLQLLEAELEFATGKWLFDAKSFQEAVSSFKKSYTIYNIHGFNLARANNIQYDIATAYMYLNDLIEAKRYYTNFVREGGAKFNELYRLLDERRRNEMIEGEVENLIGIWYTNNGRHKEAIRQYGLAARKTNIRWQLPMFNMAREFYLMGKYKQCLHYCRIAIRDGQYSGATKSEFALIRALKGDSFAKLGKLKRAIAQYEKSIELYPTDESQKTLSLLRAKLSGLKLQKEGNFMEAIKHYEKGLEINCDDVDLNFNTGLCYLRLNEDSKGVNYYNKAMLQDSKRFIILMERNLKKKRFSSFWRTFLLRKNKF